MIPAHAKFLFEYKGYSIYLVKGSTAQYYSIEKDGQLSTLALISIKAAKNVINSLER